MTQHPRTAAILSTLVATVALLAGGPNPVLGHAGGQPFLHVPADHLVPGQSFPVVAADLGPNTTVTFTLAAPGGELTLGTAVAGPDGHFETTLVLPATVPAGYLQLVALTADGTSANTWLRVGAGSDAAIPSPGAIFEWLDPSLIALVAIALIVAVVMVLRARRTRPTAQRG
jgi:hypothetical protein